MDVDEADDLYQGETKERSKAVATLLAWACPGLAYWYIGRAIKGITVNLGFVLMVEGFVILFGLLKFFPLLPLLVIVLAWVVFCVLVMWDVREEIEHSAHEGEYVLKSYNNAMVYVFVAVATFFAPILISADLTEKNLVTAVEVKSAAMYPTLLPGDVVLVDRHGFDRTGVAVGDVVAVQASVSDAPVHILRVVGKEDDQFRVVDGEMVYGAEEMLEKETRKLVPVGEIDLADGMTTMVEQNQGARYPISYSSSVSMKSSVPLLRLDKDEIFLLADNRSQTPLRDGEERIRDSRDFGPRKVEQVTGAPRYILWSNEPEVGSIRWDRIGLVIK